MAQHLLPLALLTLYACTTIGIGANNAEVEEVCGNNAVYLCIGDFTHPNPVQYEKTCAELIAKENEERTTYDILIKFLMINYNKTACEKFNERINNNKKLLKRLYCDHLKSTTSSCSEVTSEPSPVLCTTKKPHGNTTKRRKANKKRRKNKKKKHRGSKKTTKKTGYKTKTGKKNKKKKIFRKIRRSCPGKVEKNPRNSKSVSNHCPYKETKPPCQQ